MFGLLLGLVFMAQSFSLAHATRYADDSHEHNDVICEITLINAEDAAVLPLPLSAPSFTPTADIEPQTVFISASYITPQGRAPPPRSPPLTF